VCSPGARVCLDCQTKLLSCDGVVLFVERQIAKKLVSAIEDICIFRESVQQNLEHEVSHPSDGFDGNRPSPTKCQRVASIRLAPQDRETEHVPVEQYSHRCGPAQLTESQECLRSGHSRLFNAATSAAAVFD
jgi:hypothetical protein